MIIQGSVIDSNWLQLVITDYPMCDGS